MVESQEGGKIRLSKIGQQGPSERLCKFTNINHLIQRIVEWLKDKNHAEEFFGFFLNIHFHEIYWLKSPGM